MSLATQVPLKTVKSGTVATGKSTAIVVIEGRALTPLGPRIVFANEAASKLSGYAINSLVGSPLGLIYDHGDLGSLIKKLPYIAQRSSFFYMDRTMIRNGGTRERANWTIRPTSRVEDPEQYFTLTFKPVEKPQPEAASPQQAPKRVTTPSPAKVEIEKSLTDSLALTAGGVAHDFKNALQAIKSNLEMARLVTPSGGPLEAYLSSAHFALNDAESLARQMVDFTRGSTGQKKVFKVCDLLRRVAHLCTAGSRIRSQLSIEDELRHVEGDSNQIYQVLHNLVINACQAMPNGGTIHLSAANTDLTAANSFAVGEGIYTVISVRDRGCGIAPEHLPHIFDSQFTTKKDGTGVGLASCKAIIENHGGVIRAASRPGVGTEFLVFLPSSSAPREPVATPANPRGIKPTPSPSDGVGKILVVDDQLEVSKAACGLLKHLGYESMRVATGDEAVRLYRDALDSFEPIDAVLLDMTLPGGLTGEDVMLELKKIDHEVRVIATSGYFDEDSDGQLLLQGFCAVLPKPYSLSDLSEAVSHTLSV